MSEPRPNPSTRRDRRHRGAQGPRQTMRRHMLVMARGQGQGYIGQGLGIADAAGGALLPRDALRSPDHLDDPDRDRFLLSTGHYSIALWAALAEAGVFPLDELATYGADDSRLQMSTLDTTPGVEIIGGSLGHGLGQAVGMALGLRLDGSPARIFCRTLRRRDAGGRDLGGGDGRQPLRPRQPRRPDRLQRHPGRRTRSSSTWSRSPTSGAPSAGQTQEIDGNDMAAVVAALVAARATDGQPHAIVLRTRPGKGVPTLEAREKAHFVRVDPDEWDALIAELEGRGMIDGRAHLRQGDGRRRGRRRRPTVDAPFGTALVAARAATRPISSASPPTSASTPTSCPSATPSPTASSTSAWPSRTSSRSRPAWRAPATCPSPPPTASSPPAAPTTSSPSPAPTAGVNVKIVAGLPGLTTGYGGTHQAIEDLALMRMVPDLVVIDPCDATDITQATARHRRPMTGRSTCASCAARCRRARPRHLPLRDRQGGACCARAATSASSPPG